MGRFAGSIRGLGIFVEFPLIAPGSAEPDGFGVPKTPRHGRKVAGEWGQRHVPTTDAKFPVCEVQTHGHQEGALATSARRAGIFLVSFPAGGGGGNWVFFPVFLGGVFCAFWGVVLCFCFFLLLLFARFREKIWFFFRRGNEQNREFPL